MLVFIAFLVLSLVPATTFADTENPVENVIPPILDPDYRHNKDNQLEFCFYGGSYLGSTLGQTWLAGAKGYFHLNSTLAFGAAYGISRLLTNDGTPFGSTLTDRYLHIADIEAMISNDAALRVGNDLLEMDFYLTLGVGAMRINKGWEPTGLVGGGVKIYTGLPWLAFRVDVNNYLHKTVQPGKDPFDADVTFLGGVSLLFPTRQPKALLNN